MPFFDLARFSPKTHLKEVRALTTLALPMFLSQIAQVGTGFVDTLMAGKAGKADLAAVALGGSFFFTVFIFLMGVMTALNPILAHGFGRGDKPLVGRLTQQGLRFGGLLGIAGMAVVLGLLPMFGKFVNLPASTLAIMQQYVVWIVLGLPAMMLQRALSAFVVSVGRPTVLTYVSWFCFLLNIPLNYVFVYGKFGLPAMGGAGCGLASAIVYWVGFLALFFYVLHAKALDDFGVFKKLYKPDMAVFGRFLRLGVPIGFSFFIEASLFTFIMFLIAKLDHAETLVGAQQIVISLTSLIYMLPQSLGVASTTRVGMCLGQNRPMQARFGVGVALAIGIGLSCLTAALLLIFRHQLPTLYTQDGTLIALASKLIVFAAAFQLVDAVQSIASAALRGYQITKVPMAVHLVAFWGLGLAPGTLLAFWGGLGIFGFWWALVLSLTVAAVMLFWLLARHSKATLQPQNRP